MHLGNKIHKIFLGHKRIYVVEHITVVKFRRSRGQKYRKDLPLTVLVNGVKGNHGRGFVKFDVLVVFQIGKHGGIEIIVPVQNRVAVEFGNAVAVIHKDTAVAQIRFIGVTAQVKVVVLSLVNRVVNRRVRHRYPADKIIVFVIDGTVFRLYLGRLCRVGGRLGDRDGGGGFRRRVHRFLMQNGYA